MSGGGLSREGRGLMTRMAHGWQRVAGDSLLIYFSSGFTWTQHRLQLSGSGHVQGKAKMEGDATVGLGTWIPATGKAVRCPEHARSIPP
jgi:hypothetical protein